MAAVRALEPTPAASACIRTFTKVDSAGSADIARVAIIVASSSENRLVNLGNVYNPPV
jgi:hypothetical protein